jgi:hypothetical protein
MYRTVRRWDLSAWNGAWGYGWGDSLWGFVIQLGMISGSFLLLSHYREVFYCTRDRMLTRNCPV